MPAPTLSHEEALQVRMWFQGHDRGLSSNALISYLAYGTTHQTHYPMDPEDIGRCIRALDRLPFLRARLPLAAHLGSTWKLYVDHWDTLERLYREEEPLGKAAQCYAVMQLLQAAARDGYEQVPADDVTAIITATPRALPQEQPAIYVISQDELNVIIGKSVTFASKLMGALDAEYRSACVDCKRPRKVVMFGRYGPTPDPTRCDECARKPVPSQQVS